MLTMLISNITSFFTKQWGVITGVGFGLYILFRSVKYIENSALSRQEVKNLKNDIARQKQGYKVRNGYIKEINGYDDDKLDRIMRTWGELRDTPEPTADSTM